MFGYSDFDGYDDTCGYDPYESSWSGMVDQGIGTGFDLTHTDIDAIHDQWSQDFAHDQQQAWGGIDAGPGAFGGYGGLGGLHDQQGYQAAWASDGIDRSITDDPSEWDPAYGPQVDSYYTPYQSSIGYSSYDTSFIEPPSYSSSASMISSNGDPGL